MVLESQLPHKIINLLFAIDSKKGATVPTLLVGMPIADLEALGSEVRHLFLGPLTELLVVVISWEADKV